VCVRVCVCRSVSAPGTSRGTLHLNEAVSLVGSGCRAGGTILRFGVCVGPDAVGEQVELCGLHIRGKVEVSPDEVSRVRLSCVSITAPADAPALILDEIGVKVPADGEADGRVLLEDCWVRGGMVGIRINVVGCTLRRCRVQDASTYGVSANACFFIDGCTIGQCARSGRGGGILARGGLEQLRQNGMNENRIQRDHNDKGYCGYIDCRGCVGRCSCNMMQYMIGSPQPVWGNKGQGLWQKMG